METKISKWGNSLAVRIPSVLVQDANLREGLEMEIETRKDKIILSPKKPMGYSLKNLLSKVTVDNIHDEIDSGDSVGKEEW